MKKIFSSWLLDIAKYIVTALLLSAAFRDIVSGWVYYISCLFLVASIVLAGVLLYKSAEREERRRNEELSNRLIS
jgi:hypothetical protein